MYLYRERFRKPKLSEENNIIEFILKKLTQYFIRQKMREKENHKFKIKSNEGGG